MSRVRALLGSVIGNVEGYSSGTRAEILEDCIRSVAREEIAKAHGEEAAEELREVQEEKNDRS